MNWSGGGRDVAEKTNADARIQILLQIPDADPPALNYRNMNLLGEAGLS